MAIELRKLLKSLSGPQFDVHSLTELYQTMAPNHCLIATVDASTRIVSTLCYLRNGELADNFSYALADSPCDMLLSSDQTCCYPDNVQLSFPLDKLLNKLNIKAYLGTRLLGNDNQIIGILVCLFEQPIAASTNKQMFSEISYFIAQALSLQQSNRSKQLLLEQLEAAERLAKIGSWRWDIINDTCSWSNEIYRIFEMKNDGQALNLNQIFQKIHHEDRAQFTSLFDDIIAGNKDKYDTIHRIVLASGQIKYIQKLADVRKSDDGQVLYLEGTIQDITRQSQLKIEKRLADFVIDHTSESVMITDSKNKIVSVNKALEKLTGYSKAELTGRDPSILSSGQQGAAFYQEMWASLQTTGHWKGEIWNQRKGGEIYPEELSLSSVKNDQGEVSNYVAIFRDISQWKETERQLRFFADCEPLTKLANRRYFIEQLEQQLASTANTYLSVVFIDLDYFKAINDMHGHEIGDMLLCQVADRLSKVTNTQTPNQNIACRYGGDEFTILLAATTLAETKEIVKQIQQSLRKVFKLYNLILDITASIGVATYPEAGTSSKLLLRHANHATRNAKLAGRNCSSFHDTESQRRYLAKLELKEQLKIALEQHQLRVFYQPIVDEKSDKIAKFEALIRWPNGSGGYIPPSDFIPIAEEFGLIHLIGDFVLKQACRDLKRLHNDGFEHIIFSINRSISEFYHDELADDPIIQTIEDAGLPFDSIVIEITESTAMSENRYAKQALKQLKRRGISIALDDFCTGYSSLNYLIDYDVDIIKIDRSFVKDIGHNKSSQILTSTVIELAAKLNIDVIAEGVENEQQLTFLRGYGCRFIQGFYYSPALPIDQCIKLLAGKLACKEKEPSFI